MEKKIFSSADKILIELDLIDHIRLVNSDKEEEIIVHAEAQNEPPSFSLEDKGETILIRDVRPIHAEGVSELDKVCSVEPDYTSYRVQIPNNKTIYVSFIEGNFYSDAFKGVLNLKIEDGIVKLSDPQKNVDIKLNTGSVIVKDIEEGVIQAETNMGILKSDFEKLDPNGPKKIFRDTIGPPGLLINIRTIMANIYLYGRKG